MRRLATLGAAVVLLTSGFYGVSMSRPAPVLALSCSGGSGSLFAGNQSNHTNLVRGAKAKIGYVNEALCTTSGSADFSSYWAAVVGYSSSDPHGSNIYQIGIDKCRNGQCPGTSPQNTPYYFWAYGRMASSSCGAEVLPSPHFIANASTAARTYKVVREYLNGAGFFYNLYIDSTIYQGWYKTESALDSCWGGVDGAQFYNEIWDPRAESGGSTSSHQSWSQVYWYTGSAWTSVIGTPGTNCQAHDLAAQHCLWNSVDPSVWASWDTNY